MYIIPIVFAVDDSYALYLYVVISSLIANSTPENKYKIHVFYTTLSLDNISLLESLTNEYVTVECLNIMSYVNNVEIKGCDHISVEACYRLYISAILPQYPKVLYLDTDILILSDVAELYGVDLGEYAVGFVHDVECTYLKGHCDNLEFDFESMFNTGVMLVDTEKFEKQKIREKCLNLLEEDCKKSKRKMIYMDQDALMSVVGSNYKVLDDSWNFQFQYLWRKDTIFDEYLQRYEYNSKNYRILHYAGNKKPWFYPDLPQADLFWECALKTHVYLKLINKCISHFRLICDNYQNKYQKAFIFKFPFSKIERGSKIAIYAAGMVGKDIVTQMEVSKYAEVVLWVDKNCRNVDGREIGLPDEIYKNRDNYDYVVIAIYDTEVAEDIKMEMVNNGIDERKVVLLEC